MLEAHGRRWEARAAIAAMLLAAMLLAACTQSSTLVVRLRTEMRPGVEFDRVETLLYSGTGISALDLPLSVTPSMSLTETTDVFSGARVAELHDLVPGAYLVRVQLLDGQRQVGAGLAAVEITNVSQFLDVYVNRQCRGVTCPGASGRANEIACLGGRCVDPSCPSDPEACPLPECAGDDDCPGGDAACVTGRCLAGFCVLLTEDGLCDEGMCQLESGCMNMAPDAGPMDAGPMDAGPMDAGPPDTGPADTGPADTGPADTGPPDTGPADTGPPCTNVPRSRLNISLPTLGSGSPTWSAPEGLSCPGTPGSEGPYYAETVYCNREAAPYDFSFVIADPFGSLIANPTIWGYRGVGVSEPTDCVFVTQGLGSETPQILLNPGEYFTIRAGSTTSGTEGGFYLEAHP